MRVLDAVALVVLCAAAPLLALVGRHRLLAGRRGTVDCGARRRARGAGGGWALGLLRYRGDTLEWWRVISLSPRPALLLERDELSVVRRRPATAAEHLASTAGGCVIVLRHAGSALELALASTAATGVLAWLESAPPGPPRALAS